MPLGIQFSLDSDLSILLEVQLGLFFFSTENLSS